MFHLPRINLTQLHIILSCLVPWDMMTEKHAQLAKMRGGCSTKWELIAAIKILYHSQMVSVFQKLCYSIPQVQCSSVPARPL